MILVGLGNPGPQFKGTRHNLGVRVLRAWYDANKSHAISITDWNDSVQLESQLAELSMNGTKIVCLFPLTFMNNSGTAVAAAMEKYGAVATDVVLIQDDMELAFGGIQAIDGGSAKGHKGVRSVHEVLKTQDIKRLRIGIGRPPENIAASDFVLAKFTAEEEEKLTVEIIPQVVRKIEGLIVVTQQPPD